MRPRVVRSRRRRSSRRASRAVAADDGFNWGYDPWHYTTPGGLLRDRPRRRRAARWSSARWSPPSTGAGLRVVMDVVYNHTTASGQDPKSVLDRIVPGYYHRLSATGAVETSTCCANTATEHLMMEKLMVDSVVTWARDYKVDGFRFDLMGHHSLANMLRRARGARRADAVARRRRRQAHLPVRRGLELRRGRRRRALRPGQPGRSWPAPASARSPTGCATPSAAAGRSTTTRGSRASPAACSPTPTVRPVNGTPDQQRAACCCTTTRSRSAWPATCATTSSSTAPAPW